MLSNVLLLIATQTQLSLPQAADAVAQGENVEEASARLVRGGQQGLWLLHARAKKESGEARRRLFALVGAFASTEAEWALVQELKTGPVEGRLGAMEGLVRCGTPSARSSLLRQAPLVQAELQDPLADALARLGDLGDKQLRDLAAHQSEGARQVALRYLAKIEPTALAKELCAAALLDATVISEAVSLAAHLKDPSQVYPLADVARSESLAAEEAVRALAAFDSRSALSELGSVVAFEAASEKAWQRAAELLRDRDRGQLARAMARASEPRRDAVARVGGIGGEPKDFEAVIELLDDPSLDVREAAFALLAHGGEPAREAAAARLNEPLLPELKGSIEKFLAMPPSTPTGAVTLR